MPLPPPRPALTAGVDRARPARSASTHALAGARRRLAATIVLVGLTTAGCAGGPSDLATGRGPDRAGAKNGNGPVSTSPVARAPGPADGSVTPTSVFPAPVSGPLPRVVVNDVGAGSKVDLATIGAGRPLLVWFWAPH